MKSPTKLKTKVLYEPIYGITYHVLIGEHTDAERYIRRKLVKEFRMDHEYACFIPVLDGHGGQMFDGIIYFSPTAWKSRKYKPDAIAHECLHAVINTLCPKGVHITERDQEPACYLLSWLVREIHQIK